MVALAKSVLNKSAFYAEHIKKWQQSKISQEKYCKSVNISYPNFVYWLTKSRKNNRDSSDIQQKFLPLKVSVPDSSIIPALIYKRQHKQITVTLSTGIQLLFPLSISSTVIVDCIKTLEEAYDNTEL